MAVPEIRCMTPDKVRYATVESAKSRANYRSTTGGKLYYVYLCPCGWYHLTTNHKPRQVVPRVTTLDEMVALSPVELRAVIAADVKNRLDVDTARVLRLPEMSRRWQSELKLLWAESLREQDNSRDGEHRRGILTFQKYIAVRRQEANVLCMERERMEREAKATLQKAAEAFRKPVDGSKSSIRREALYQAVRALSKDHLEELRTRYVEELKSITESYESVGEYLPLKFLTRDAVVNHVGDLDLGDLPETE